MRQGIVYRCLTEGLTNIITEVLPLLSCSILHFPFPPSSDLRPVNVRLDFSNSSSTFSFSFALHSKADLAPFSLVITALRGPEPIYNHTLYKCVAAILLPSLPSLKEIMYTPTLSPPGLLPLQVMFI
jgi:hypothetical protein